MSAREGEPPFWERPAPVECSLAGSGNRHGENHDENSTDRLSGGLVLALSFAEQPPRRAPPRLTLIINVGELWSVSITHNETVGRYFSRPRRRQATGVIGSRVVTSDRQREGSFRR